MRDSETTRSARSVSLSVAILTVGRLKLCDHDNGIFKLGNVLCAKDNKSQKIEQVRYYRPSTNEFASTSRGPWRNPLQYTLVPGNRPLLVALPPE